MGNQCFCHGYSRASGSRHVNAYKVQKEFDSDKGVLGLWRHPDDRARDHHDLSYWVGLAKLLEEAKFHGIFFADVLGIYDVYKGPENITPALASAAQTPISDPRYI